MYAKVSRTHQKTSIIAIYFSIIFTLIYILYKMTYIVLITAKTYHFQQVGLSVFLKVS